MLLLHTFSVRCAGGRVARSLSAIREAAHGVRALISGRVRWLSAINQPDLNRLLNTTPTAGAGRFSNVEV